mmetsp:Transcript_32143/g.95938  ORF Transcript_32143/g.95938 Transcript_32143/m.95938 type:complete len:96 (-) Transcript_32143:78-365(-)
MGPCGRAVKRHCAVGRAGSATPLPRIGGCGPPRARDSCPASPSDGRPSRSAQAKTTKKITLRLTCTNCKTVRLKPIKRAKHFEICDKKPKGKGQY